MPFGYPVNLELSGKKAVVIGEEAIRAGKVESLEAAGATVTVIRRPYEPGDLVGAYLCVASSSSAAEREAIYAEGRAAGVLMNVMDDVEHCDWSAPALVRRGDLVLAISTGGKSPALAKRLREDLEEQFGPEWAEALDVLEQVRRETLSVLPDLTERSRRWQLALDTDELISLVSKGRSDEARERLVGRLTAEQ